MQLQKQKTIEDLTRELTEQIRMQERERAQQEIQTDFSAFLASRGAVAPVPTLTYASERTPTAAQIAMTQRNLKKAEAAALKEKPKQKRSPAQIAASQKNAIKARRAAKLKRKERERQEFLKDKRRK